MPWSRSTRHVANVSSKNTQIRYLTDTCGQLRFLLSVQAVAVALYNPEMFKTLGSARLDLGQVLPEKMTDQCYQELLVSHCPSVTMKPLLPKPGRCVQTTMRSTNHNEVYKPHLPLNDVDLAIQSSHDSVVKGVDCA